MTVGSEIRGDAVNQTPITAAPIRPPGNQVIHRPKIE
jgi:hypothetical protein